MKDRRQAPRRLEEIALSVAEMSLLAAALKVHAARNRSDLSAETAALLEQDRAADLYICAERDAIAARQAVTL